MDRSLRAHLTSDGSLRFFALVTLLNLPDEMLPDVILLDEPELGLHPAAFTLVADMIKSLATDRQVIVATQSPLLVDAFGLDEIIVAELSRHSRASTPMSPRRSRDSGACALGSQPRRTSTTTPRPRRASTSQPRFPGTGSASMARRWRSGSG